MKRFLALTLLMSLLLPGILMTGCAANSAHNPDLLPASALPSEMQTAPTRVREAYQFAVANADLMQHIPCYCGCGAVGHKSNYDCYIKSAPSGSTLVFDQHALGCSLCVDITQDAMRLAREGKSPGDIRAFIVSAYSKFGPANQ